jgi:hypothetical protein
MACLPDNKGEKRKRERVGQKKRRRKKKGRRRRGEMRVVERKIGLSQTRTSLAL